MPNSSLHVIRLVGGPQDGLPLVVASNKVLIIVAARPSDEDDWNDLVAPAYRRRGETQRFDFVGWTNREQLAADDEIDTADWWKR
ncbi:MAG TPA: hypothetical protein VFB80_11645 [Pirellulaceae bacterium]|nr:hypothetical protein [Pirellulaceae bacterium]